MATEYVHAKWDTLDRHLLVDQNVLLAPTVLNIKPVLNKSVWTHVQEHVALTLGVKQLITIQFAHAKLDLLVTHSLLAS